MRAGPPSRPADRPEGREKSTKRVRQCGSAGLPVRSANAEASPKSKEKNMIVS
jgi:hypothetical protein